MASDFLGNRPSVIDLHKIIVVSLLPVSLALVLVVAGLALRRRALCWIGIAVLWMAHTPFFSNLAMRAAEGRQFKRALSDVPTGQAIVALTGGREADRFFGGVMLYKANKAPLLIFTSGPVRGITGAKPDGELLIDAAAGLGIPRDHLLTTASVANTRGEIRAVTDLLASRWDTRVAKRLLLVTSAFHMRRAQMLFDHVGIESVPFPVDFKASTGNTIALVDFVPSAVARSEAEIAMREFYGLAFYWLFRDEY